MQPSSQRTRLRRGAGRARYDDETIRQILADALYCHVAVDVGGYPAIIPTAFAVVGDTLYLHGSTANRVLRAMRDGRECCVSVTLLDGLVLARSMFHHSVNYRAVILYGHAREVTDAREKHRALDGLVDHMVPGRSREARAPSEQELARTLVLAVPLSEVSAKVRTGPPVEEEEDYALDVWAGEIPLRTIAEAPVPDPRTRGVTPGCVTSRCADLSRPSRP